MTNYFWFKCSHCHCNTRFTPKPKKKKKQRGNNLLCNFIWMDFKMSIELMIFRFCLAFVKNASEMLKSYESIYWNVSTGQRAISACTDDAKRNDDGRKKATKNDFFKQSWKIPRKIKCFEIKYMNTLKCYAWLAKSRRSLKTINES